MDAQTILGGLIGGWALGSLISAEERAAGTAREMGRRLARARLAQNGNGNGAPAGGAQVLTPAGAGPSFADRTSAFDPFSFGRWGWPWGWQAYQWPYPAACPPPAYPAYGYPSYGALPVAVFRGRSRFGAPLY